MELYHDNRVFFEPTSHSYLLDGDVLLQGVTELMRKHNLGANYAGIPKDKLEQAAAEGTAIHKEIQDYEKGENLFASELVDEYKKLNLKFIEAEYPITDYEQIASAIDCVYEGSTPDSVILVDIKTTQKYHRRPLEWQLGIYKVYFEKLNPNVKVESCYCLWIDKKSRKINGFLPVAPVTEEEVQALLDTERKGEIYIDTNDVPELGEVLTPEEADELVANAGEIAKLENTLKLLKEASEKIKEKLLDYMEENNLSQVACPGGTFTKRAGSTRTSVDSKLLQKQWPAVYAKVLKETKVKASITFKPNNS